MFSPKNWWNIWPTGDFKNATPPECPGQCHEYGGVLVHVDEAVQLAQHVIRDVPRGARLAVQVDRDVGVLETYLLDEGAQTLQRDLGLFLAARTEFLIVDRQQKSRCAALLLRERSQVAIAGDPKDLHPFFFNGLCHRTYAQPAGIFRTEIFIDDDNRKTEFHIGLLEDGQYNAKSRKPAMRR